MEQSTWEKQFREGKVHFCSQTLGARGLPMPLTLSLVKSRASKCKGGAGSQKAKSWRSELGTRLTLYSPQNPASSTKSASPAAAGQQQTQQRIAQANCLSTAPPADPEVPRTEDTSWEKRSCSPTSLPTQGGNHGDWQLQPEWQAP